MVKICIKCGGVFEGAGQRCDRCMQRAYDKKYKKH